MHTHAFDKALQLQETAPGQYTGQTSADYWNMVGPFGGTTAALALRAILQHPDLLGDPLSLTVNYAGALVAGSFTLSARPVRTNRSTQHWTVELLQTGADGAPVVANTATAVTGLRRETWSMNDTPMPAVPAAAECAQVFPPPGIAWIERYEMRPVVGGIPQRWDGSGDSSLSQLWMRDQPSRPLDFCALTAMADIFYPRVWLRRARHVPAGTVSITVYFHASAQQLAAVGDACLLGQARAQEFRNGFFDQTAQLWSPDGTLLATTHQIVYFKE